MEFVWDKGCGVVVLTDELVSSVKKSFGFFGRPTVIITIRFLSFD